MNNHLSHLTTEHTTRPGCGVGNQGHGFGQAHKYCGVKPDNGISTPTPRCLDPQQHYKYKQPIKRIALISSHSKRPHTFTKMNDNINMDITIAG